VALGDHGPDKADNLLVCQNIPDSVASQHDKFVLRLDLPVDDIGVGWVSKQQKKTTHEEETEPKDEKGVTYM